MASRAVELLLLLGSGVKYSKRELREKLKTGERNLSGLIRFLKEKGFDIPRANNGQVYLKGFPKEWKNHSESILFTDDEKEVLSRAVLNLNKSHALKNILMQKLNCVASACLSGEAVYGNNIPQITKNIILSLRESRQLELIAYCSGSSNTQTNRLVEVFNINDALTRCTAYEPASDTVKSFMIERIGEARLLKNKHQHCCKHKMPSYGVFGFSGSERYCVCLHLDILAQNLLKEEYPKSRAFIKKINENQYEFKCKVPDIKGVGRFVLGLYDHIEIIDGDEIKQYVRQKLSGFSADINKEKTE